MAKELFIPKKFSAARLEIIDQANDIIEEYMADGYDLTLRQLYYQFVSRALIPNKQSEYKKLSDIIGDARLAGEVDWDAIKDRGRKCVQWSYKESAKDAVRHAKRYFLMDKWKDQPKYVEVWIEKEALAGVIQRVCMEVEVPFAACKGYASASFMYESSKRFQEAYDRGQECVILHLGDHDASGIDMTQDIDERLVTLNMYHDCEVEVKRIALTMDQIKYYDPPPNPAKTTDPRAKWYIAEYGDESWELDALDPSTLTSLIRTEVGDLRDNVLWNSSERQEQIELAKLQDFIDSI